MHRIASWLLLCVLVAEFLFAASAPAKWVVSWTGSSQGPYPSGNASAQPDLKLAFPAPQDGARDQSFRMIVKPELWGTAARLRFSNAFGTQTVKFDGVFVGLQLASSAVVAGTNRRVTFGGKDAFTLSPGETAWSDPVGLPFAKQPLHGRKLAVSFHVAGESGPMTWHAKALQTSYLSFPGAGAVGQDERESAFPLSTTSWFFLDAIEVQSPADAWAIVALGDSITDGTLSTLNGDDRWPDVLARRLHAAYGDRVAVVNAGIGGNQVVGPAEYAAQKPASGGPSALARLDRDVLSLSGVAAVIWLEGINDLTRGTSVEAIQAGMKEGVGRIRAKLPGVRVIGATLTPALGAANVTGSPEQDQKRKQLNEFIRASGLFDSVADFDRVTTDPATGAMKAEFVHNTTIGGEGDKLHPNRLGYLAMGAAIDLTVLKPAPR